MKQRRYFYDIYGLIVKSNVRMPLLPRLQELTEWNIELTVNYCDIPKNERYYMLGCADGQFELNLGRLANYRIDTKQDRIQCDVTELESFFSTFFNIPFSIYFAAKGEILLHACSMKFGKGLICFAGDKGVGKSTLTWMLNCDTLTLYSDDTLRITDENMGFRAHCLAKFTSDTVSRLAVNEIPNVRNAAGKHYSFIRSTHEGAPVKGVVLVKRTRNAATLERVNDRIIAKNIYFSNIVGSQYFNGTLIKNILKVSPTKLMSFILHVPDDIDDLDNCKMDIARMLIQHVQ